MGEYKHWVNSKEPGVTLFITTTVLDFVHAFHRPEIRDAMVFHMARECRLGRATLYGYVVMPHHVHLVVRMHEKTNGPDFMRVFKRRTGEAISKLLSEGELRQFDQQRGLNGNTFWQYSFRGIVIESEDMFWAEDELRAQQSGESRLRGVPRNIGGQVRNSSWLGTWRWIPVCPMMRS